MELLGSYKLFWFALGLAFLILEVATPGIVFLFFGLGSWVVMLILLAAPIPPFAQWLVFTVVSVLALLTLRKHVTRLFAKKDGGGRADSLKEPMVANSYIGRVIEVIGDIAPDRPGLVELNGTNWQARSQSAIPKGAMVRVKEVSDLTLVVEPLEGPK
jgi:membrane protein implicated in regulation of membrane protease activity